MNSNDRTKAKPAKLFHKRGTDTLTVHAGTSPDTHTVLVSDQPGSAHWSKFFALRDRTDIPHEFMSDRPTNTVPASVSIWS
jgi:hypothetical protein